MTIEYLRHFRIGGYAIFDFAVSFLAVYLVAPLLSKLFLKIGVDIPKVNWLYLTLPISIAVHLSFGNITPMTANFLDLHGHILLKIIMLGLLFMGLKGIKIRIKETKKV